MQENPPVRVFVSYAWEDEAYRSAVRDLAVRLRAARIDARLDAWHLEGVTIPEFMNREVRNADRILVVCSPKYRRNVHAMEDGVRTTGAGWEAMLVGSASWANPDYRRKVVPVLLKGTWTEAAPDFMSALPYIDLTDLAHGDSEFLRLVRILRGYVEAAPPIGGHEPTRDGFEEPLATAATISEIRPPSARRYVIDRLFPRLHTFLQNLGMFAPPPEYEPVSKYLRELLSTIDTDIASKTGVFVRSVAKEVPRTPFAEKDGDDPFVHPIQLVIRQVMGRVRGDRSTHTQVAASDYRSKAVRHLLKALTASEEPLILLGDPGSGKTLTLQQAARASIAAELHRVYPSVTVFISLGEFHVAGKVNTDDVMAYIKKSAGEVISPFIDGLDKAGRLVVIFDGLDEMSRDRYAEHTEALSKFAGARRGRTITLFSCRIADFTPSFIHKRLVLLPFDRSQVLEYLRRSFREPSLVIDGYRWTLHRLANHLTQSSLAIDATNPFNLWLLCFHLDRRGEWPRSRVQMVDFYLQETYARKQQSETTGLFSPSYSEAVKAWAKFAYKITERNLGTAIPVSELKDEVADPELLRQIIHLGHRCGFLAVSSERHAHLIRFEHHLQEYFAAAYIHQHKPDVNWLEHLDSPQWQETLLNLVVMAGGGDAVDVLSDAIEQSVPIDLASSATEDAERPDRQSGSNGAAVTMEPRSSPGVQRSLTADEELLLADRVELGTRVWHGASAVSSVEGRLASAVRHAVDFLTLRGNPSTQMKMVRAGVRIKDEELAEFIRRPLRSDVRWLRDQALILLSGDGLGFGANLPREMGFDLARGEFLVRARKYLMAISNSHRPGAARSLGVAGVCAAIHLGLLVLVGIGFYLALIGHERGDVTSAAEILRVQAQKPFLLGVASAAIVAGLIALVRAPTYTWLIVLGTIFVIALAPAEIAQLWAGGRPNILQEMADDLRIPTVVDSLTFLLIISAGIVASMMSHVAPLALYLSLTRRIRAPDVSVRVYFRNVMNSSGYDGFLALCLAGLLAATLWLLVAVLYHFQMLGMIVLVGLTLAVLAFFVWRPQRIRTALALVAVYRRKLVLAVLAGIGILTVLSLFQRVFELVLVFCFIAVGIWSLVWAGSRIRRWMVSATRRRPFPPGTFEVGDWKRRLGSSDPISQEDMLFRTSYQTLKLRPQEFLHVLQEVATLVRKEPALSRYWQRRAELEDLLRQEAP